MLVIHHIYDKGDVFEKYGKYKYYHSFLRTDVIELKLSSYLSTIYYYVIIMVHELIVFKYIIVDVDVGLNYML